MKTVIEKIRDKELPAVIVYEDEQIISFIDNNPIKKGHLLICPKIKYKDIYDLPEELLFKIMKLAQLLTKKMIENLNLEGVSLMQNNAGLNTLNHFHLHLIPRKMNDYLKFDNIRIGKLTTSVQEEIKNKINF